MASPRKCWPGLLSTRTARVINLPHDDVIKWKHFTRYWPFVRGIHWSPVISPHKGQWRRVLMLSLIWAWINGWVNNGEAGDLRRHRGRFDVTVMMDFTGLSIQYAVWHLLVIEICYASINLRACVRNYIPITLWNVITYPYPEVRYNTPVSKTHPMASPRKCWPGLLSTRTARVINLPHDDVIKWKHFTRYWPFVRGIHWSPVNSPHKGQWRRALIFSLICAWINGWVNNGEAGDLRRHRSIMTSL